MIWNQHHIWLAAGSSCAIFIYIVLNFELTWYANYFMQWRMAQKNGSECRCHQTNNGINLRQGFRYQMDCLLANVLYICGGALWLQQWWRMDGCTLPFQKEINRQQFIEKVNKLPIWGDIGSCFKSLFGSVTEISSNSCLRWKSGDCFCRLMKPWFCMRW